MRPSAAVYISVAAAGLLCDRTVRNMGKWLWKWNRLHPELVIRRMWGQVHHGDLIAAFEHAAQRRALGEPREEPRVSRRRGAHLPGRRPDGPGRVLKCGVFVPDR